MSYQGPVRHSISESPLLPLASEEDGSFSLPSSVDLGTRDNVVNARRQSALSTIQSFLRCSLLLGKTGLRWTAVLLPSFVRGGQKVESTTPPLSQGRQALAALNGLRGVACLIVFNYHFLFVWTSRVDLSWGTLDESDQDDSDESAAAPVSSQNSLLQLPFVRLLYAGHAMVIVFFVISGYVLSHKPMKLIRAQKYEELSGVLSSSVFRRGIRLFGPTLVATFVTMCLASAGCFEAGKGVRTDRNIYKGINEEHPVRFDTLVAQLGDWVSSMGVLIGNVWNWDIYFNNYDPHLWTIPLEFRSSIVLFVCLLGLSRLRPIARLTIMSVLVACCIPLWARWDVFLFLSGMMFAELDIISGIFTEAPLLDEKDAIPSRRSRVWIWSFVMLLGLFLNSCPSNSPQTAPGYSFLTAHVPNGFDWQRGRPLQAIGGTLIVWSFMHLPKVQRLFTTAVAQYLGKISYAFYIVHGPILHGFGYGFILRCWSLTGDKTSLSYASGLGLAALVILPLAIWAADLFWRAIDTSFVQLARFIETKLSSESRSY